MGKIVLKKAGKNSYKKIDVEDLLKDVVRISDCCGVYKFHKKKGRPKIIYLEWLFKLGFKKEWEKLNSFTKPVRIEILGEWYGKEYLTDKSCEILYKTIKTKEIPINRENE